ncbi:LysR family transcriptional regulator [Plantactinospora sp. KLBMP9567]|uniref:LysR family transcriptional regulator n=1 Tax=Plantactinospora sp. KLBMP9567 TaxID=3085900 RepID=UPI0029822DAF|nr:LysR family transcriptional regulator [Plantactinospora sp. KLBMP9567]MDW5323716.1 LysR family transcriptional regulator [Plantactinospora sp. KLBMP9567]
MSNSQHADASQPTVVDEASVDLDVSAVRAFVAVADGRYFSEAATRLGISQQAVSKRIAVLEQVLGVALFTRTSRGAQLTVDGQAFLPHARTLLRVEARAVGSVRPGRRTLRVEVLNHRIGPAGLMRNFHRAYPDIELDVVTFVDFGVDAVIDAIRSGAIDASFRAVAVPEQQLREGVTATRVLDDPHELLTGPTHPLAAARTVTPADLVGHRIWIPGIVPGTEWAAYYDDLAATFELTIERVGPNFGTDHLLDILADSSTLATLTGEQVRLLWPADYDLRRIPVREPAPVYPHSLIWHRDNPHPGLATLRNYIRSVQRPHPNAKTWTPKWAMPHV